MSNHYSQSRIQRRRAGRAPPVFDFYWCIFGNFNSITRINFIVISMQCLQYVFYSLLTLQKHRVCVKGHIKRIFRPQKLYRAGTARSPRALKFLDPPLTLHAMPKFCSPSPAVIIKSQHERSILERDIKQLTTNKQSFNNSKEN